MEYLLYVETVNIVFEVKMKFKNNKTANVHDKMNKKRMTGVDFRKYLQF